MLLLLHVTTNATDSMSLVTVDIVADEYSVEMMLLLSPSAVNFSVASFKDSTVLIFFN